MALRRIQCRDHGGIFAIHPKRGRQPVRCKEETPCDRADYSAEQVNRNVYNHRPQAESPTKVAREAVRKGPTDPIPRITSEAPKSANPSLPLAKAAKERLTAVGWVVQGKAGSQVDNPECGHAWWAEITASRGSETLFMRWLDGELTDQQYAMEFEKPSQNGYPNSDLHFDPTELSDSELVRMIKGMKVTWWNTIAGSKETAIIGGNVTIEHIFFTNGDEDNSKRIVKFIDHGGGGFRAFHVSALLKVG